VQGGPLIEVDVANGGAAGVADLCVCGRGSTTRRLVRPHTVDERKIRVEIASDIVRAVGVVRAWRNATWSHEWGARNSGRGAAPCERHGRRAVALAAERVRPDDV